MERKVPDLTFVKPNPFGIGYCLMQHDQPSLCIEQRQILRGVPSARRSVIFSYNLFYSLFCHNETSALCVSKAIKDETGWGGSKTCVVLKTVISLYFSSDTFCSISPGRLSSCPLRQHLRILAWLWKEKTHTLLQSENYLFLWLNEYSFLWHQEEEVQLPVHCSLFSL